MTTFFIDCPAKNTLTAIELMADSMQRITFEPAEFARELTVVRRELADGEVDRQRVLWKLLQQTVYTTHPARHPIIGYLEVLNRTTNQTIIDFYHERYVPNNQVFVVVGDVDTQQVLDEVAKHYAGTPRRPGDVRARLKTSPSSFRRARPSREMDGTTYDLAFAWPTVKLSHPDLYALDVAAYILGEGESSRLVQRLKYEKQAGAVGQRHERHAASTWTDISPCWPSARRKRGSQRPTRFSARSTGCATNWSAPRSWPRPEAEGRRTGLRPADGPASGRQPGPQLSSPPPIRCSTRATSTGIQKVTAEQIRDVARRYLVPQRLNRVIIAPPGGAPKSADEGRRRRPRAKSALCGCPMGCACC